MKHSISCALLALLVGSSCKKETPEASLPPATHTGANTAGCLIDGQPFVATGYGSGLSKIQGIGGGFAANNKYYLRLNGKLGGKEGTLHVFIDTLKQVVTGTYSLNKSTPYQPAATPNQCRSYAVFFPADNPNELYGTDDMHTGKVEISYVDFSNPNSSISSGTFEFTAVSNLDHTKTIQVTDGRFDRRQE